MSTIVLPIVISGRSYVVAGGIAIYMKKGLTITDEVESWNPDSQFGKTGERHKARALKIAGDPEGEITAGFLNYAFAALLDRTKIGKSIVGSTVEVCDIDTGDSYTLNNAGLFAPPPLMAGPDQSPFGTMTWIGIGDITKQPTDAAFLATMATTFTADTSRDESKIITDIYSAALGTRTTPFNAMGSMAGFKITPTHNVKLFNCGDVGYGDAKLLDVGLAVSFIPSNLTQANVMGLRDIQDTGAVLPGQQYAKAGEDLVITGTQIGWVFTCKNMGVKKMDQFFGADEHRHKEIQFVNKSASATGAPSPYFAFTAPV